MKRGHLAYKPNRHQMILCVEESDEDIELHCGQVMTVELPGEGFLPMRLEMDVNGEYYMEGQGKKIYNPWLVNARLP